MYNLEINNIIKDVANVWGAEVSLVHKKTRKYPIPYTKKMCVALLVEKGCNKSIIAKALAYKDVVSVNCALRSHRDLLTGYPEYRVKFEKLRERFELSDVVYLHRFTGEIVAEDSCYAVKYRKDS